tara:strand:+ start:127 stop:804 length:678 start_codon:yes stop_codon:yes gene_type:complete
MKNTTLIVGGSRGIGLTIKEEFLKRGDNVYTASRSSSDDKNHFSVELPNKLNFDLKLKINYLIFSHRYRSNDWDEDFNVTVKGVYKTINILRNSFLKESSIVIIGSNAGKFIVNDQSASYHATRSALEGLTKYYSVNLGKTGIRCNCILPNTIIKPENVNYFTKENEKRKTLEKITPLARMGNSNDISSLALFLCSPEASFISGQIISVDGGLSNRSQESIATHF